MSQVHTRINCRLLSRLALPICLNYLYMIQVVRLIHHDDDKVPQTAFAYVSCHGITRTSLDCKKMSWFENVQSRCPD